MKRYSFVVGGTSDRGPEALILDGCQVIGSCSLAVAGKIAAALNRSDEPLTNADRLRCLHAIVVEQHKMLAQMIETRPRDEWTGKESDDSKRARQLLEQAGQIVSAAL